MTIKAAPLKDENPKVHPDPTSNTEKNPDDWVSGDDAMTGAQASFPSEGRSCQKRSRGLLD
jgi:hypothetical protein